MLSVSSAGSPCSYGCMEAIMISSYPYIQSILNPINILIFEIALMDPRGLLASVVFYLEWIMIYTATWGDYQKKTSKGKKKKKKKLQGVKTTRTKKKKKKKKRSMENE